MQYGDIGIGERNWPIVLENSEIKINVRIKFAYVRRIAGLFIEVDLIKLNGTKFIILAGNNIREANCIGSHNKTYSW